MLAIGPSTIPWSRGNDHQHQGLFTTVDVTKDTILSSKKGILLNKDFWHYNDYKTSDMRVISIKKINNLTK